MADSEFFISEVSCYEFLRTASSYADYLAKHDFMKKWPTLEVNRDLLKASTLYFNALSNSKKSDEDKQSHAMNKFSDADIFIGATAIRYKSLLVTTNGSDFPRPIFDEIKSQVIGTEKIFILKPDTEYFESWIQKFMKEK